MYGFLFLYKRKLRRFFKQKLRETFSVTKMGMKKEFMRSEVIEMMDSVNHYKCLGGKKKSWRMKKGKKETKGEIFICQTGKRLPSGDWQLENEGCGVLFMDFDSEPTDDVISDKHKCEDEYGRKKTAEDK